MTRNSIRSNRISHQTCEMTIRHLESKCRELLKKNAVLMKRYKHALAALRKLNTAGIRAAVAMEEYSRYTDKYAVVFLREAIMNHNNAILLGTEEIEMEE